MTLEERARAWCGKNLNQFSEWTVDELMTLLRDSIAEEREACARIADACEQANDGCCGLPIAAAIRARQEDRA